MKVVDVLKGIWYHISNGLKWKSFHSGYFDEKISWSTRPRYKFSLCQYDLDHRLGDFMCLHPFDDLSLTILLLFSFLLIF